MRVDSAWREWWFIVLHPRRYVEYVRFRRRVLVEVGRAISGPPKNAAVYVGPTVGDRMDFSRLPVQ